ncbi:MAG: diaminopimelate epimerase [Oligoflexia bacterium]|nr:diaminopimelate epimerase [Oligoflexia bacterium]
MKIPFTKMEGLGNDYIYIDLVENSDIVIDELKDSIPIMCNRNFGIGSDGVIFIGIENDVLCARIFNSDGSEAGMCGNGLRCVARLAYDRGYTDGKSFGIFLKDSNRFAEAWVGNDEVTINMGTAETGPAETLVIDGKGVEFTPVDIGNPHAVIFVDRYDDIEIIHLGRAFEFHKRFPERTNVEFVKVVDRNNIELRVWERGVGETLACGSGACAGGIVAVKSGCCAEKVKVSMPGGSVTVEIDGDGLVKLTGTANYVFDGSYSLP